MYDFLVRVAWVMIVLAVAPPARADDAAAATVLFDRAEALVAAGKLAEACSVYAASFKADPQLGVLLHLADCNEKIGKTATAWVQFRDAIERAKRMNDDKRAQFAQGRVDALAPKLVRLRVVAPATAVPGLAVKRDDTDITALLGDDAPVDPGEHVITATAPGFDAWQTTVKTEGEGKTLTVQIAELNKPGAATTTVATTAPLPPPSQPARFGNVRVLAGVSASEYSGDSPSMFQHDGSGRPGIWIGARASVWLGGRFFLDPGLAFHNRAFGVAVCPTATTCSFGNVVVLNDIEVHVLARVALRQRHTQISVLAGIYAAAHLRTINDGPRPMPDPAQSPTPLDVGVATAFELFVGRFGGQILIELGVEPISATLQQQLFGVVGSLGVHI
jgi:hypothetical protein